MKLFFAVAILFSLFEISLSAQEIGPIQCDRPDQTETPFTVPKNHFQFETGFSYEQIGEDYSSIVHPTILSKYGINDRVEIRLITEISTEQFYNTKQSGLNPVAVGFKANLLEERKWIPKTSFIGHLTIPDFASNHFQSSYYAPSFRFTMQHTLTDKLSLSYNLGAEWDGEFAEPSFLYTLTAGYSITEKLGSYVELFGFANRFSPDEHQFDAGVSYLIRSNILADISGGVGLTEYAPDYYFAVGFSFRLKD